MMHSRPQGARGRKVQLVHHQHFDHLPHMDRSSVLDICTGARGQRARTKSTTAATHLGDVADEEALRKGRAHSAAHQARHQLAHRQPVLAAQPVQQRHRVKLCIASHKGVSSIRRCQVWPDLYSCWPVRPSIIIGRRQGCQIDNRDKHLWRSLSKRPDPQVVQYSRMLDAHCQQR